jgi:4-amino-4-deoxy-L-arabinose transferase-like glycosyltransferase
VAGAALGLALGSKFSALFLIPAFVILALIRRPAWKYVPVTAATALMTLAVLYQGHVDVYLPGLQDVMNHYSGGHEAYLFGEISRNGWWYYFPAAFALKSPVGFLALIAIAAGVALWKRPKPSFDALLLLVPASIYLALSLHSNLDLGLRHLLPVYPMLCILVAIAVIRHAPKWLTGACLVLLIIESCSIFPNYLAFFNALCGGPSQGPRYLLDSNIDWGQDTKKLKAWLEPRNIHNVCGIYFGLAMPAHYGIEGTLLPGNDETQARAELDCVAMASVTPLYGLYVPNDKYRWLREHVPVAKIGYSIYVYDLRKQKVPILAP